MPSESVNRHEDKKDNYDSPCRHISQQGEPLEGWDAVGYQ